MRASIKSHLREYVVAIGRQINTNDPTEIITAIIQDHMRGFTPVIEVQSQKEAQPDQTTVDDELIGLLG